MRSMDATGRRKRSGRPAIGAAIVDKIECGALARLRLHTLVSTLTQERTVGEACEMLGVSRARLHKMRDEWLAASAQSLEPRRPGRQPHIPTEQDARIDELMRENERLRRELYLARERAQLAAALAEAGRTSDRLNPAHLGKR